ncbi:hypothetical protein Q5H92_14835 [Hymenobacter sp. M29]|uniref:Uncharacterized protein n=1 Tax=Hymenobacter mellowenesis TaxID=3063995 RepID=A0ABT9AG34_9BACT|nr:hypothetical protein [Hymenobacter sp. M29]MDO7847642.1 hypothetical protein [Hymenobacter sp. M29]
MPQFPYTPERIEVDISDKPFNGGFLKRKAVFTRLLHAQDPHTAGALLSIDVLVCTYSRNPDGTPGDSLHEQGFPDVFRPFTADNRTVVNLQGDTLAVLESEQAAAASLADYQEPVMLQLDFFQLVRDTQPLGIKALIVAHIQAADALGRFS